MAHDDIYFNEHDENQVKKILKSKKKKKMKRRFKLFLFLLILVLIGAYFVSDFSKVQSITVVGNEEVAAETILSHISVSKKSFFLFVNTSKIEKEVKEVSLIKKASVSRDFFGHIKIEIEEAEKIGYCVIEEVNYVIDELGNVAETQDENLIHSLQAFPQISGFPDLTFLKKFAKEYAQIPELIKNQTSDVIYSPKDSDESRLKFIMDNGKILYLRVEDMVDQLSRFDYEANMTAHADKCEFSFEGKNVYMSKCQ